MLRWIEALLFWLGGFFIGMWVGSAEAEKLNVKFLIAQPAQVSREYVESVTEYVRWVYRRDLGLRLRTRHHDSYHVAHGQYSLLSQRYSEFEAYDAKLSNRKRWIKIVLVPPWFDEQGIDYTAGFAKEQHSIAIATIRQIRLWDGADRFDWDHLVIEHELAHVCLAQHRNVEDGYPPNIMDSAAGRFAGPDLKFLRVTKSEIRRGGRCP